MIVNVSGQEYEIDGILMGQGPVWWLIKKDGQKMTGEQFNALPDADKDSLFNYVKQYIDAINAGKRPD